LEITKLLTKNKTYEGCQADFKNASIVLFGAGFDGTSTYRPGSRFAPNELRNETYYAQEDYSPYLQRNLSEKSIHDLGDVRVLFGKVEETMTRIEKVARFIVQKSKKPVCLGGEHLVSYPMIKTLYDKYPSLHIVQLDAHLDAREELFGKRYSHGTVMRRISNFIKYPHRIYQVAIRSGSQDEFEYAQEYHQIFPFTTKGFLNSLKELDDQPVYLTIDLDVFDPSLLPGTGTPEAGGIFFQEYIELLKELDKINIVGADLVELSPYIDSSNASTIVASQILRELLMIL
jgi:agmatinase